MRRVGAKPTLLHFASVEEVWPLGRNVSEKVEQLVAPILEENGFELVEVEYKKEGQNWFLRVFMDREDKPVDLDDCSRISERISEVLDSQDPIPGAYILEVSSPGAERPLKRDADYKRAIGKNVHVRTYESIEGRKTFEGILEAVDSDKIVINENGQIIEIPRSKIAKARLAIVF